MIRVNLLTVDRAPKKKAAFQMAGQKLTIGASLILVLTALFIGWRYWSLTKESKRIDDEIAAAQAEAGRLHGIIQQVQQFEQRKAQLSQRVNLIDDLRKGQNGPVHMLDQISRALPPMLWLTELKQSAADVTIDGKCVSNISLSDFVANLEASGYFRKGIELISSATEPIPQPPGELVKFTLKATFQQPGDATPPVAPGSARPGARSGG